MADKVTREETLVASVYSVTGNWAEVQSIVTILRTLGYLNEIEYSKMNTLVVGNSGGSIRSDGAETIDLARGRFSSEIKGMDLVGQTPDFSDPEVRHKVLPGEY